MMKEYWIDFNGWFRVEAEDIPKANDEAVCQIYNAVAQALKDFHFEIDCVEECDD